MGEICRKKLTVKLEKSDSQYVTGYAHLLKQPGMLKSKVALAKSKQRLIKVYHKAIKREPKKAPKILDRFRRLLADVEKASPFARAATKLRNNSSSFKKYQKQIHTYLPRCKAKMHASVATALNRLKGKSSWYRNYSRLIRTSKWFQHYKKLAKNATSICNAKKGKTKNSHKKRGKKKGTTKGKHKKQGSSKTPKNGSQERAEKRKMQKVSANEKNGKKKIERVKANNKEQKEKSKVKEAET